MIPVIPVLSTADKVPHLAHLLYNSSNVLYHKTNFCMSSLPAESMQNVIHHLATSWLVHTLPKILQALPLARTPLGKVCCCKGNESSCPIWRQSPLNYCSSWSYVDWVTHSRDQLPTSLVS